MDKNKLQKNLKNKLKKHAGQAELNKALLSEKEYEPLRSEKIRTKETKVKSPSRQQVVSPTESKVEVVTEQKESEFLRSLQDKIKKNVTDEQQEHSTFSQDSDKILNSKSTRKVKASSSKINKEKNINKKKRKVRNVRPLRNYIALISWYSMSVLLVLFDQMTKALASSELIDNSPFIVTSWLQFDLVHNPGAAFSLFAEAGGWQRPFLVLVSFGVSIYLIIWLARLSENLKLLPLALTLLLGGAVGNLIDRIISGYVVDFIAVHYQQIFFPSFNVADSAITIGALLLFIDMFFGHEAKTRRSLAKQPDPDSVQEVGSAQRKVTVEELLKEPKRRI